MKESLYYYFANWDPMGFISELGAPTDEYDVEVREILRRYKPQMDNVQLGDMIHGVFVEYLEIDPIDFKDECSKRSEEIRSLLQGNDN